MSKNKIILGAGLSGLIYNFYHRDSIVLSKDIGGRIMNNAFDNTVYLHVNEFSKKLLDDIKIHYEVKVRPIYYFIDGVLYENASENQRKNLINKKAQFSIDIKDLRLSTKDNFLLYYEFDLDLFLSILTGYANIIKCDIKKITKDSVITNEGMFEYSELISSLPANVFWNLSGEDRKFETRPTYFYVCDSIPDQLKIAQDAILYVNTPEYEFTRINNKNGKYLIESPIDIKDLSDFNVISKYVDNHSFIIDSGINLPPENTIFIGRFATHEYSYKQEDVIKEATQNYNFSHIWNMQKKFLSTKINLKEDNKSKSILYSISVQDKVMDFLNSVDYKNNSENINEEEAKNNLISIFKYLLNICIVFNIDIHEFIKIFKQKK